VGGPCGKGFVKDLCGQLIVPCSKRHPNPEWPADMKSMVVAFQGGWHRSAAQAVFTLSCTHVWLRTTIQEFWKTHAQNTEVHARIRVLEFVGSFTANT